MLNEEKWRPPLPNRTAPFIHSGTRANNSGRFGQPPSAAKLKAATDLFAPIEPPRSETKEVCEMVATKWAPRERNTLIGTFDLTLLPLGLTIREVAVHQRDNSRWIGLPAKAQIDSNGQLRRDPRGKILYVAVLAMTTERARDAFQDDALAALDRLLDQSN